MTKWAKKGSIATNIMVEKKSAARPGSKVADLV